MIWGIEMKVIDMSEKAGNGFMRTPESALKDALESLGKEGEGAFEHGTKLLVLCLDDTEGQYSVTWVQAGLKMRECLSLCEVGKTLFLKEMNYILSDIRY